MKDILSHSFIGSVSKSRGDDTKKIFKNYKQTRASTKRNEFIKLKKFSDLFLEESFSRSQLRSSLDKKCHNFSTEVTKKNT